ELLSRRLNTVSAALAFAGVDRNVGTPGTFQTPAGALNSPGDTTRATARRHARRRGRTCDPVPSPARPGSRRPSPTARRRRSDIAFRARRSARLVASATL